MSDHRMGTREEWQAARDDLAQLEAEYAELGQKETERRRQLPWVPVDKEYVFDTEHGKRRPVLLAPTESPRQAPGCIHEAGRRSDLVAPLDPSAPEPPGSARRVAFARALGVGGRCAGPAVVLSDRMSCLNNGIVANVVVPHPDYVRFVARFGFRPDFCESADPESNQLLEALGQQGQRRLPGLVDGEANEAIAAPSAIACPGTVLCPSHIS